VLSSTSSTSSTSSEGLWAQVVGRRHQGRCRHHGRCLRGTGAHPPAARHPRHQRRALRRDPEREPMRKNVSRRRRRPNLPPRMPRPRGKLAGKRAGRRAHPSCEGPGPRGCHRQCAWTRTPSAPAKPRSLGKRATRDTETDGGGGGGFDGLPQQGGRERAPLPCLRNLLLTHTCMRRSR
jgi:hypothetical protein